MRKQDYLLQLIHSLTPSEKKYFRQYISARHDRKDYEKMFDVLQQSKSYDADAISQILRKSKKNLADDKEYLQEILLRALHNFHANSMSRARSFNAMIESEILVNKGLVEFGIAHIRKVKKTMLPGEDSLEYFMVLKHESNFMRKMIANGLAANEIDRSGDLILRLEMVLLKDKLVQLYIDMLDLSADIKYINSSAIQRKAKDIVQKAEELVKGKKLPALTHMIYHRLLGSYYFFLGVDTKLAVKHILKALQRYESESDAFKRTYRYDALSLHCTLVQAYFELRDHRNVSLSLVDVMTFASSPDVSAGNRQVAEELHFRFITLGHTAEGRYQEALDHLTDSRYAAVMARIHGEYLGVIELIRAINYFHLQRYDESLQTLQPLLSTEPMPQFPETRVSARVLNLMIQYEIGNTLSLPDYLRSAQRFFKKEELMTTEVKLFFGLMNDLVKTGNKTPVSAFLIQLENVYSAHRLELIGHFVLLPWLKRFPKKTSH